MINPRSAHIEESWEFVKWYFQEGISYLIPGGRTPAYNGFDPETVEDIFISGYEDIVDRDTFLSTYASNDREVSAFNQTLPVIRAQAELNREAENAIVGTKTIERALADAKRAADAILAE
jgi:ABC-type glycerol-3-phosphate transport system substrate-binding protein